MLEQLVYNSWYYLPVELQLSSLSADTTVRRFSSDLSSVQLVWCCQLTVRMSAGRVYLVFYNGLQFLGWSYLLLQILTHFKANGCLGGFQFMCCYRAVSWYFQGGGGVWTCLLSSEGLFVNHWEKGILTNSYSEKI